MHTGSSTFSLFYFYSCIASDNGAAAMVAATSAFVRVGVKLKIVYVRVPAGSC